MADLALQIEFAVFVWVGALFHSLIASLVNVEVAILQKPCSSTLSKVVDLVVLASSFTSL